MVGEQTNARKTTSKKGHTSLLFAVPMLLRAGVRTEIELGLGMKGENCNVSLRTTLLRTRQNNDFTLDVECQRRRIRSGTRGDSVLNPG